MKRYPNYKDSGVPWLGQVPSHWSVKRARFLCSVGTGSADTEDKENDAEIPFYVRSQTIERISKPTNSGEAVLTAGDGAGVGKVYHHHRGGPFAAHQRVYVMQNFSGVSVRYFFYALSGMFAKVALDGGAKSTVDSLRRPMLTNFFLALPDQLEQRVITDYLDLAVSDTDKAIESQELMIELLKERRSAIITQAVTKGLDPKANMKGSGVPWLGKVPAHWELKKVKHLFRYKKVINRGMACEDRLALTMSGVVPRALDDAEGLQTEDYSNYQIVEKDDLLFKLIDLQNIRTSRVGLVPSRGIVSPAYIRIKKYAPVPAEFGYWYFMSIYVRNIFNTMGAGVRQSLTQSDLLELPFLLPSEDEMNQVVQYLERMTSEIDSAISSQERMIELLKERRATIIAQAVTGQVDVR